MPGRITQREFIEQSAAAGAAAAVAGRGVAAQAASMPERPSAARDTSVRLFSLGGQATLEKPGTDDESIAIINRAIDLGVNYLDTAAAYGRGISQGYLGRVMATRRREVFLASKTHDRTRDGSLALLDESLRLLKTDHLDLWQLHHVGSKEELDQIFGKGGAIEALQRARDQKMVRFLGITGHADPDVLVDGISRFDFDTILMALNPADRHYRPFVERLLPLANRKQMGVDRDEDSRARPALPPRRHHVDAGRDALRPHAPGQHGDRRLRHRRAARGERRDCPGLRAACRGRDGAARAADRAVRRRRVVVQDRRAGWSRPGDNDQGL